MSKIFLLKIKPFLRILKTIDNSLTHLKLKENLSNKISVFLYNVHLMSL